MSRVCWQVFGQVESQRPNVLCQKWFADALKHCTNQFYLVHSTDLGIINTLWSYFKGNAHDSDNTTETLGYRAEPFLLGPLECQSLIHSVNEDYLNMFQNQAYNARQNQTMAALFASVIFGVFVIVMALKCAQRCMQKKTLSCFCPQEPNIHTRTPIDTNELNTQINKFIKTNKICPKLLETLLLHYGSVEDAPCAYCMRAKSSEDDTALTEDQRLSYRTASTSPMPPSKIPIPLIIHPDVPRAPVFERTHTHILSPSSADHERCETDEKWDKLEN